MDYIASLLTYEGAKAHACPASLLYMSMAIGAWKLTMTAMSLLALAYRHTLKGQADFMTKYNPSGNGWAVVTGGSDGIGEQFCRDLAKKGFNICIIARNEEKMKEKLKSIKEECGKNI